MFTIKEKRGGRENDKVGSGYNSMSRKTSNIAKKKKRRGEAEAKN